LSIANGGQPTLQNTLDANSNNISSVGTLTATTVNATNLEATTMTGNLSMGSNSVNFSTAATSSDQTLMTMGSSSVQRLVFEIGNTSNDFNGKIIYGGANSFVEELPSIGLTLSSAGTFVQINNPISINGIQLTDSNGHIESGTGTPTITAYAGAGTSPIIVSVLGTDLSGVITIYTGTAPSSNYTIASVTFSKVWGRTPRVLLTPANAITASLPVTAVPYISGFATTSFAFSSNTTALVAATEYGWNYMCMC